MLEVRKNRPEVGSYEVTMLSHSNISPSLLHMLLQVRALTILITIQPQDIMHLSQTTDTHPNHSSIWLSHSHIGQSLYNRFCSLR